MIKNIFIKNFILIEQLTLDFQDGFSAFTGETGAGKSILIDAISLLKADRASASYVMKGKDKAIIEGTFDLSNDTHALQILKENGFEDDEEYYTFSREISASGKSVARLNRRIIPLSLMREIVNTQLDIHGQRDNAYLLQSSNHLLLLDRYLHLEDAVQLVKEKYKVYTDLVKEQQEAMEDSYNENDLEYFKYQIQEIENAHLKPEEEEELEEKEKNYLSLKNSMDKFQAIEDIYSSSIESDIYSLLKLVESLKDVDGIDSLQSQYTDAYYSMVDAVSSLIQMKDNFSFSEEEINEMEERLYTIQKLKRKYNTDIQGILEYKNELELKVQRFDHRQEYLQQMDDRIKKAENAYLKTAQSISDKRKAGAPALDKAIAEQLSELHLNNAKFLTCIEKGEYTSSGIDKVEFKVAMNKGQEYSPLAFSASGGELSRLMLGLKVIFTHLQKIETIIFDEIDTGVSGKVAFSIGKKMKELSEECQVFAVTHLAPVASWADHQYLVSKESDESSTHTTIHELDEHQRIEQLAFISSGEITEASTSAAKELLSRSHL